jgi:hypothetical protein
LSLGGKFASCGSAFNPGVSVLRDSHFTPVIEREARGDPVSFSKQQANFLGSAPSYLKTASGCTVRFTTPELSIALRLLTRLEQDSAAALD